MNPDIDMGQGYNVIDLIHILIMNNIINFYNNQVLFHSLPSYKYSYIRDLQSYARESYYYNARFDIN